MNCFKTIIVASAVCLAGMANSALAQRADSQASPFGQPTAQQKQVTVKADSIEKRVQSVWDKLSPAEQQQVIARLTPLSEAERLAVLMTVPQFKNFTPEESQVLLTLVERVAPYPVPLTIQPADVYFMFGRSVQLQAYLNGVPQTSGITWTAPMPLLIDANGVISVAPGVMPGVTPRTITATHTATGATATTTVNGQYVNVDFSGPAELSAAGGQTISGTAVVDARVQAPLGAPEGTISFYAVIGNNQRYFLCATPALTPLPDESGLRRATGSCTAAALPASFTSPTVSYAAQYRGSGEWTVSTPSQRFSLGNSATVVP